MFKEISFLESRLFCSSLDDIIPEADLIHPFGKNKTDTDLEFKVLYLFLRLLILQVAWWVSRRSPVIRQREFREGVNFLGRVRFIDIWISSTLFLSHRLFFSREVFIEDLFIQAFIVKTKNDEIFKKLDDFQCWLIVHMNSYQLSKLYDLGDCLLLFYSF